MIYNRQSANYMVLFILLNCVFTWASPRFIGHTMPLIEGRVVACKQDRGRLRRY